MVPESQECGCDARRPLSIEVKCVGGFDVSMLVQGCHHSQE